MKNTVCCGNATGCIFCCLERELIVNILKIKDILKRRKNQIFEKC